MEGDPRHLLASIAKILTRLKIPYIVTGGIGVLIWGRPRFTADIDIVIELKQEKVKDLVKALQKLKQGGYIDEKVVKEAILHQGEFNFIDNESGVKVDFWVLQDNEFDNSRFSRKISKKIFGQNIFITAPEDLILIKLKWYKESYSDKQIEDVKSILKISGDKLDKKYLKEWAKKIGVGDELNKVLS